MTLFDYQQPVAPPRRQPMPPYPSEVMTDAELAGWRRFAEDAGDPPMIFVAVIRALFARLDAQPSTPPVSSPPEPVQAPKTPVLPHRPYAGRVGRVHGSATSAAAGESQEPTLGTKQAKVLELLRQHNRPGLTDDELEYLTGWRHQSVSARRRELVLAGLVRSSPLTKATSSGRQATIWEAVRHG
jgi:hypothetical protein